MNIIVYNKLIEVAKKVNGYITYQKLSYECNLGLDMSDISQRNELAHMLGEISTKEARSGRPMLSVVVFRDDQNMPGQGFFDLATELGKFNGSKDDIDKLTFFSSELKKCYDLWQP